MARNGQQFRTQLGEDFLVPEQGINGFTQQEGTGPTAQIETPVGFELSGRGNEPLTLPNLDMQVDSDSLFLSDLTSMDNHPTEFSDVLSGEYHPDQRVKAKRHEKPPKVVHPLDRLAIEGSMPTVTSVALDTFGNLNLSDAPQILGCWPTVENSEDLQTGNRLLWGLRIPSHGPHDPLALVQTRECMKKYMSRATARLGVDTRVWVISIDSDFQAPDVAVNGVAQRRRRFKFPSVIHSAKALEYMSVPDNLTEVGSGTILTPATVQAVQVPLAEPSTPMRKTLINGKWAEYICEECTETAKPRGSQGAGGCDFQLWKDHYAKGWHQTPPPALQRAGDSLAAG
ncbi:hypothetical protein B0F90DRAFT_1837885 [Multifurca ochricompacta]|uniref:Uncharacterized protein n=1 Tax=Multifurca ochricompacta TaxID=376703 RepID=A0AAD4LXU7_9AGAM|nr:hypothetical protein B0F90DRAFT_1837885 [Multifurca ochricompacta]